MDNEKLQINLAPGQEHAELVIREVGNENPYKLIAKEPLNLQVDGVITCIYAFLEKRWGTEQIDKEHTHILVNREKLVVTLVTNENDERTTQTIIGSIQLSRQFAGFHITATGKRCIIRQQLQGQHCQQRRQILISLRNINHLILYSPSALSITPYSPQ